MYCEELVCRRAAVQSEIASEKDRTEVYEEQVAMLKRQLDDALSAGPQGSKRERSASPSL